MRLPRTATRRWMVAMAVVVLLGGIIGVVRLKWCRDRFVWIAQFYTQAATDWRGYSAIARESLKICEDFEEAQGDWARPGVDPLLLEQQRASIGETRSLLAQMDRAIAYYESMARRCHRAARYP